MAIGDLVSWIEEQTKPCFVWYVKRLSGNDTLANGSHQAGPYIPKEFLFSIFPTLNQPEKKNPDIHFDLRIDSKFDEIRVRAVWYNNKLHGNPKGGRNETRLTNFGGASSALLDPENTGALAVFVFELNEGGVAQACRVWVCRNVLEEDIVEERVGVVEPGTWKTWTVKESNYAGVFDPKPNSRSSCWLKIDEISPEWLEKFPTGAEIIRKTVELRPGKSLDPDSRLIERRNCEFEVFRSVEEAVELPWIKKGFDGVEEFVKRAQTILQRRKSRSGRSLELHVREIFLEEGLKEGKQFSHGPESEAGKKPDFLFPSALAYKDKGYPDQSLKMLAVKTTCKDRWRQILNEADRIPVKHLLTLQEGVSVNQFKEMLEAGVKLVVPRLLVSKFPKEIQKKLKTFGGFLEEIAK